MSNNKDSIRRRLILLEDILSKAYQEHDTSTLYKTETEINILTVYLKVLDCSNGDNTYLERHEISLTINPVLLNSLDNETRLSIACLTAGECK